MTTHEERQAIAARLRKSRKVESPLVSITYHRPGSAVKGRLPGTEYLAIIMLPKYYVSFFVYLPAPKNSRQSALATLCNHLDGLTLSVKGATVTPS